MVVILALAFDLTNGFHDSSNSIATLVATRAAPPGAAIAIAGTFQVLGPLVLGTAVADTVGGIVNRDSTDVIGLVAAALSGALAWNLLTWARGLRSSSSHALVGGLVGAALVDAGTGAVNWGGMSGLRPSGVRDAEHNADDAKRAVRQALRSAFATPLDPEDLYELSERTDLVLNPTKNIVREAELIAMVPDE